MRDNLQTSRKRPVSRSVVNGAWSACPLRAHTTQGGYFFSVGYWCYIRLSYEEMRKSYDRENN